MSQENQTSANNMESSQSNTPQVLSLDGISYDIKYRLSQGSVSQIVRGLSEMVTRLGEGENAYQQTLYPVLREQSKNIVSRFNTLLQTSSASDYDVRKFNLHGYDGRIKGTVITRGVRFNTIYQYANFGDYLKTITQRLTYILERQVPQRYSTDEGLSNAFVQLRSEVQDFVKYIHEEVEPRWNTAVTEARTAGGDSVQENLRKREQQRQEAQERRVTHTQVSTEGGEQTEQNQQTQQRTFVRKPFQRRTFNGQQQNQQSQRRPFQQRRNFSTQGEQQQTQQNTDGQGEWQHVGQRNTQQRRPFVKRFTQNPEQNQESQQQSQGGQRFQRRPFVKRTFQTGEQQTTQQSQGGQRFSRGPRPGSWAERVSRNGAQNSQTTQSNQPTQSA
jgi:hypothetical protein